MSELSQPLAKIVEGALLAAGGVLTIDGIKRLFPEEAQPETEEIKQALAELRDYYDDQGRGIELTEVASGYRIQVRSDLSQWIVKLWEEKPAKYSRAILETLVLIAYRQPITRSEIEEVRGVGVSTHIIKTLQEREWIRVVGNKEVPGRPALYGTTRQFLDYFNLKSLGELPSLMELNELNELEDKLIVAQLELQEIPETDEQVADDASLAQEGSPDLDSDAETLELTQAVNSESENLDPDFSAFPAEEDSMFAETLDDFTPEPQVTALIENLTKGNLQDLIMEEEEDDFSEDPYSAADEV